MINTTIYRRAQFKKMTLLIIALLSLYAFFFRPVQALIENGLYDMYSMKLINRPNGNEKTVSLRSLDDTQEILTGKATPISADELYMIFTQSNELIEIVDARSEDEYQTSHIESARSLVLFYCVYFMLRKPFKNVLKVVSLQFVYFSILITIIEVKKLPIIMQNKVLKNTMLLMV